MTRIGSLVVLVNFIIAIVALPNLLVGTDYNKVFILYFIIIVLCLYLLCLNLKNSINVLKKSPLIRSINIFLLYLSIHYFCAVFKGVPQITFVYLAQIAWISCANAFYVYGRNHKVDFNSFEKNMLGIGVCLIGYLFLKQMSFYDNLMSVITDSSVAAEFININPYLLASLTGILFLLKKGKMVAILAFIIIIGIQITGKRGPLVSILGAMLFTAILQKHFWTKVKFFILLFLTCSAIYTIVLVYFPESFDYLSARMIEDDTESMGSGRVGAWTKGYDVWSNYGGLTILFGMGTGTINALMYKVWGLEVGSHSDFFDVLFQYGYIGLFFQLTYISKIIAAILYGKRNRYSNAFKYIASFVLISMTYTMSYSSPSMIISSTLLFYYLGRIKELSKE